MRRAYLRSSFCGISEFPSKSSLCCSAWISIVALVVPSTRLAEFAIEPKPFGVHWLRKLAVQRYCYKPRPWRRRKRSPKLQGPFEERAQRCWNPEYSNEDGDLSKLGVGLALQQSQPRAMSRWTWTRWWTLTWCSCGVRGVDCCEESCWGFRLSYCDGLVYKRNHLRAGRGCGKGISPVSLSWIYRRSVADGADVVPEIKTIPSAKSAEPRRFSYLLCRAVSVRFLGGSKALVEARKTDSVSSSCAGRRRFRSNNRKYTIFSVLCLKPSPGQIHIGYGYDRILLCAKQFPYQLLFITKTPQAIHMPEYIRVDVLFAWYDVSLERHSVLIMKQERERERPNAYLNDL